MNFLRLTGWLQRSWIPLSCLLMAVVFVQILLRGFRTQHWRQLSEIIAVSTRHAEGGLLFPEMQTPLFHAEAIVYFPGLPLLASRLVSAGITGDALYYVLVALACCTAMTVLLLQLPIVRRHDPHSNPLYYVLFALTFLHVADAYRAYVVTFKPDTLAAAVGLAGALLGMARKDLLPSIAGGLMLGGAIIFKQQYVAFLAPAMVCFAIHRRFAVCVAAAAAFAGMMWVIHSHPNAWHYTVFQFQDDGFRNFEKLRVILVSHYRVVKFLTLFLLLGFAGFGLALANALWKGKAVRVPSIKSWLADSAKFLAFKARIHTDPIFMGLLGYSAITYVSFYKFGGDAGNVELAAMLLLPYVWLALRHLFHQIPIAPLFFCVLLGCVRVGVLETRELADFRPAFAELREAYANRFGEIPHIALSHTAFYFVHSENSKALPAQEELVLRADSNLSVRYPTPEEMEKFLQENMTRKNIVAIDFPYSKWLAHYARNGGETVFENTFGVIVFFPKKESP